MLKTEDIVKWVERRGVIVQEYPQSFYEQFPGVCYLVFNLGDRYMCWAIARSELKDVPERMIYQDLERALAKLSDGQDYVRCKRCKLPLLQKVHRRSHEDYWRYRQQLHALPVEEWLTWGRERAWLLDRGEDPNWQPAYIYRAARFGIESPILEYCPVPQCHQKLTPETVEPHDSPEQTADPVCI